MADDNHLDNMLTPSEVAQLLHIHSHTLKRWTDKGRIMVYRINPRGDRRYARGDIARFLAEFNPYRDGTKKVH